MVYRKPLVFNAVCKLAMLLSTAVLILGVVLVWLLYPRSYDYKQAGGRVEGRRDGGVGWGGAEAGWSGPVWLVGWTGLGASADLGLP